MKYVFSVLIFLFFIPAALAQTCTVDDFACVSQGLLADTAKIEKVSWRDQTYREIAKTMAARGDLDGALQVVDLIQTPDTQALTIRGIGMAAARNGLSQDILDDLFTRLRAKSEAIQHPPSYAIALTYIAMSQAFAGDDDGAWATAAAMENDALRHKAYGETAEIQAELGKYDAAIKSIRLIDTESFRNKAYSVVSKILADKGNLQDALNAAANITNAYKKARAVQHVLDVQDKIKAEGEAAR